MVIAHRDVIWVACGENKICLPGKQDISAPLPFIVQHSKHTEWMTFTSLSPTAGKSGIYACIYQTRLTFIAQPVTVSRFALVVTALTLLPAW